jgi:hypothetical protein
MNDVWKKRVALRTTELTPDQPALQVEITERKKAEEQLQHDAFHDTLTDPSQPGPVDGSPGTGRRARQTP